MRKLILVFSAIGALTLGMSPLSGCGDGSSGSAGSAGTGSGLDADAACKDLATAICGQYDKCSPFLLEIAYGDQSTCEARVTPHCLAAPDADGAHVTPEDIKACADAYAAQSCEDAFASAPSACNVPGDKADGAACAIGAECKGNICDLTTEGQCGKCATPLAEGAACDVMNDLCDDGLFCGASSKCESYAKSGDACTDMKPCYAGLSCNAGKCGDRLAEGADCSNGEVCDFNVGAICSPVSQKCKKIAIAKLGEACGFDQAADTFTICAADSDCDNSPTGKCAARPKGGEACSVDATSGDGNCVSGYDCVSGKCTTDAPTCM